MDRKVLFELDFQRHTEEYEREIIVIELRERLDTVTDKEVADGVTT